MRSSLAIIGTVLGLTVLVASSGAMAMTKEEALLELEKRGVPATESSMVASAGQGDTELIRLLAAAGVSLEARQGGDSALIRAVYEAQHEAVRVLLELGADPNAGVAHGWTPLMEAIGDEAIAGVLLKAGAKADLRGSDGRDALSYAIQSGYMGTARMLIEAGADVHNRDNSGRGLLALSILSGRTELLGVLLEKKPEINAKDVDGKTPFIYAVETGRKEAFDLLMKARPDLNITDNQGKTALIYAAMLGQGEAVKALLKAGAKTGITDKFGGTALSYAKQAGNKEITEALKKAGAKK